MGEKIPNWLRYIFALPYGLLISIIGFIIMRFSLLLFADPKSLYFAIISFIFKNGVNILLFFYGLNLMLPNHKFVITIIISIIFGLLYTFLEGMIVIANNISIEYTLAYIEVIISLIISCWLSYNKKYE